MPNFRGMRRMDELGILFGASVTVHRENLSEVMGIPS
jgi:Fe2+ transport system protein FeoA